MLQCGRGCSAAESLPTGWTIPHDGKLQCGRGCSAAESSASAAFSSPSCRFNVAAAVQPRKAGRPKPGAGEVGQASMWPRLFSRGKLHEDMTFVGAVPLQCGRGCSAAERKRPKSRPASRPWLQCGRGCSAAESWSKALSASTDLLLQCGRGCSAAERKSALTRSPELSGLQCGRGCSAAESTGTWK